MQGGDTMTIEAAGPRLADELVREYEHTLATYDRHDSHTDRIAAWAFAELRRKHGHDPARADALERIEATYWHHDREERRPIVCLGNAVTDTCDSLVDLAARARRRASRAFSLLISVKGKDNAAASAQTLAAA